MPEAERQMQRGRDAATYVPYVSNKSRMDLKVPTAVCHTALLYVLYYCSYCSVAVDSSFI